MRKFTIYLGIWLAIASFGVAEEQEFSSRSGRAIVVGGTAELFVGEQSHGKVAPGTILRVAEQQGDWLYVPSRDAWIKVDRVVSIEASEAHFTAIIEEEPTPVAYHHRGIVRHALGFNEQAIADLDEAIKRGLKTPAVFINRANVWHSLGNDRNALADVSQAIEAEPENPLAYNNRGLIWASLGNHGKAIEDFTTAIRLDDEFAEAFNNRGVTRAKQGQYESAYKDYSRAIDLNVRFAEAYANRGFAAKNLGRYLNSLEDYRRAVELAPGSPQAFNDAAWLVATCPHEEIRDPTRAVEYALYACRKTGHKKAEYIDTLAAAYASDGQFDLAVKTQQQALTMLSESARPAARARLKLYLDHQPFVDKP